MIERPLIVSPTLAATLGLHEAIVLQLLTEWAQLQGGEESWQLIDKAQLQQLLPFWEQAEIEKILHKRETEIEAGEHGKIREAQSSFYFEFLPNIDSSTHILDSSNFTVVNVY